MGADLILVACPVPVVAYGEDLDRAAQRDVLRERIARLSDEVLAEVADYSLGVEPDDDGSWRQQTRAFIEAALDVLSEFRRDTTTLIFAGREWLLSGGLSWGDVPCDSYDSVAALAIAEITHRPLRTAELRPSVDGVANRKEG